MSASLSSKKIIFSGIQPSGRLMLGNFIGALQNWVKLQSTYDCLYCLVDQHAITVKQDPKIFRERVYEGLAIYLACGLDPKKNTVFLQSQVPAHAELGWILSCHTYMGELSRMTQFKDKSEKQKNIGVGLFIYPALMAADILLYGSHLVPVGADQKQHIELTRDLAIRMNNTYGDLFVVPEVFIPPVGAKIMSLTDPTKKMSKSDKDPNATVFLMDGDDVIRKKIKRATTDSGTEITDSDDKPGIRNLLTIQSALLQKPIAELVASYSGKQYGHLKVETAEIVVQALSPLRKKCEELLKDKTYLDEVLKQGQEKASTRAQVILTKTKQAMGFVV